MVHIFSKSAFDFCGCAGTGAAQFFKSDKGWRYGTTKAPIKFGQEVPSQSAYCCCGPTCPTPEEARKAFLDLLNDTKHLR